MFLRRDHRHTGDQTLILSCTFNTPFQEKQTALMDAARGGHGGIVQALLACGADTNIQNEVDYEQYNF